MKINKYILGLGFAMATMFAACNTDNEGAIYRPSNAGVKFQVESAAITLNPSDTGGSVYLFRSDASSDLTVGLTAGLVSKDSEGNEVLAPLPDGISVPSSVSFKAGEGSVLIPVSVGDITLGASYPVRISISDTSVAPELDPVNSMDVTVMKDYVWTRMPNGMHIISEWMGDEWDDVLEVAEGTSTLYRAYNVYIKGYSLQFWVEGSKVTVKPHACDYSSSYGDIWAEGEGTFANGVADMTIEFYVPGVGSFGPAHEIIQIK